MSGEAYYHLDCGNRLVEGYCKDCSFYPDLQSVTKGEAFATAEGDEEFFDRCVIAILGACPELDCVVGAAIVAWGDAMRGMVRFRETQTRITAELRGTFKALAMVDDRTDEQRHEDNDCGCVSDPDDPQRSHVCIHAIRMLSAEAVRILADGPEFSGGDGPDPEDV